jgi:hypothetical protein
VVASRGGERLARALASVAWAGERIVLDPAGRLGGEPLSEGVVLHAGAAEPAAVAHLPWLFLLTEDETVPAALADAVTSALTDPVARGYRVRQELTGFGVRLQLPGALLRLAPRDGTRLGLTAALSPVLRTGGGPPAVLGPPIQAHGAERLAEAVADLDADAATLAALLGARGVRPGGRHLLLAPLVAGGRVLGARRVLAAAWGRWFLAALAWYRGVTAYAKLWELRRSAGMARA